MFILRRLPALFALLLLGALSLRLGLAPLVAAPLTLLVVLLLFVPMPLVQTVLAAVLWAGVLAWAGMAWLRLQERTAAGQPWLRLAAILGAVAVFTAWSAWLIRSAKLDPQEKKH